MIRNLLRELLEQRGWTPYRLAKESGLPAPTIYQLVRAREARVKLPTLNAICRTLDCQPGDLMAYVPDRKPARHPAAKRPRSA